MLEIKLKAGREKALLRGHPWIFSGSIAKHNLDPGQIAAGATVRVIDSSEKFLAWGAISPVSKIRVRVWSRDPGISIDENFFRSRIAAAISNREGHFDLSRTNAYRLINAESDGIPGLVVDKYAGILVVQFLASGAELWRDVIADLLIELTDCDQIYERSDANVRDLEGLPARKGILRGSDVLEKILIAENNLEYWVDIQRGQKTGFYLDQRDNRLVVRELAVGKTVLDCFAYSGGFSVSALAGGAERVLAIDSSAEALDLAEKNTAQNSLDEDRIEWLEGDVFQELRKLRDKGQQFDLIILDPPKFAPTIRHAQKAARGYKDINLLGFKLLKPGGLLVTFSCSGGISEEFFQKILAGAAHDAGVEVKILTRLGPGPDHPVALSFPEGAYLKGFVLQRE